MHMYDKDDLGSQFTTNGKAHNPNTRHMAYMYGDSCAFYKDIKSQCLIKCVIKCHLIIK